MYERDPHRADGAAGPIGFVLHAAGFPRSVRYCLSAARDQARRLPRADATMKAASAQYGTPATGGGERAGREDQPGSRARPGLISVIVAALAAWLLVSDLQVFPWPGKLALFLVIFAAIRWLMRFLWNLGRGGGPMGGGR